MLRPLGPDITITLIANSMQGGEYRKLAEKTITDVCVNALATEQAKPYYEEVNEVSNMPPWKTCPFPAVSFRKMSLKTPHINFSKIPGNLLYQQLPIGGSRRSHSRNNSSRGKIQNRRDL